jgi:hypothetical protein
VTQKVYVTFGPFAVGDPAQPLLPSAPVSFVGGWLVVDDVLVSMQSVTTNYPALLEPYRPELRLTFADNILQMEQKMIQTLIWAFARATPPVTITEDEMVFVSFNLPAV